jgi:hypothetical protein
MLIAVCTMVAGLAVAAPANAETAVATRTATTAATTQTPSASAAASTTAANGTAASDFGAQPNYAAGTYYYVCVNTDGTTRTLLYGVATTTCHGSFLQQWLESGQFVKSIPLSGFGTPATGKITFTPDCEIAIVGAAVAVLSVEDSWIWYTSASVAGYGLHACISS